MAGKIGSRWQARQPDQKAGSSQPHASTKQIGSSPRLSVLRAHFQGTYFDQQDHTFETSPDSTIPWEASVPLPEPVVEDISGLNHHIFQKLLGTNVFAKERVREI